MHRLMNLRQVGERCPLSVVLIPMGIIWGTIKDPDAWFSSGESDLIQ